MSASIYVFERVSAEHPKISDTVAYAGSFGIPLPCRLGSCLIHRVGSRFIRSAYEVSDRRRSVGFFFFLLLEAVFRVFLYLSKCVQVVLFVPRRSFVTNV